MEEREKSLDEGVVGRIIQLLSSTRLTVFEIAERTACSRNVVASINRRFQIRKYPGCSAGSRRESAEQGKERRN
jgi:hypothetical protein